MLASNHAMNAALNSNLPFDPVRDFKPLLHTWSLAIEEQFYIVVALLAFALARLSASRRTWAFVFGGLALASMAATVALATQSNSQ